MNLPKLKAEFILDPAGKPRGRSSGEYEIRLHVEDVPKGAFKVTYQLDESYYDPLREVRDPGSKFAEELTSYGDYVIQARVRTKDHAISTSRSLIDALRETHGASADPDVLKALKAIEEN